jgi:hypothetical protein
MKHLLIVLCLGLALAVHASARLVVPSLPEAVTPDAEVSTNIELNVDAACGLLLSILKTPPATFPSGWMNSNDDWDSVQ